MKLTGQKLKEKRESARLTISEVSLATKINPKVLTAMENGESEHLPAKTFLRGFVRAYAGFLKMNVAEVLELFTQELNEAGRKDAIEMPIVLPKKETPSKSVDVDGEGSGTFRMFIIGGILILIVLIIGVRSVVQKYERERNVDTPADLAASKVVPLDEKPPSPPTNPASSDGSSPAASAAKAPTPENKPASTPDSIAGSPPPIHVPTPAVVTPPPEIKVEAPLPEPVKVMPKSEPPKGEAKAEPVKAPAAKGNHHEIILEALDNVEISYKLNGQNKKIPMAPGQVHTIITDQSVAFDVSDGGALNITDNGHDKGPAGDLGHRKQISVP